jgi:hypothetical protein
MTACDPRNDSTNKKTANKSPLFQIKNCKALLLVCRGLGTAGMGAQFGVVLLKQGLVVARHR